jgi:hypothetical protein
MASGICEAWRHDILEELFGGAALAAPATLYFGLCTACDHDGTVTGEPSGNGYARKEITNDGDLWEAASEGSIANEAAITFAAADGGDWGALDTWFIANHATNDGAAIIVYGPLTVEKTITDGDTASFAIGALTITISETA